MSSAFHDSSAKYYQNNNERLQKKTFERYQSPSVLLKKKNKKRVTIWL